MSQVLTSTVRQSETIMVHSPMKVEGPGEPYALRPDRTSPDQHDERMTGMARNQTSAEQNTSNHKNDLKINTSTKAETYGEDQVCMCTPVQHVPRPCNSFILYRTRMAQQTIAENPGASNPQISKILGERWAKESDEVKAQWKSLAEEESKRHRQQYPDYRFQPKRRGSKASAKNNDDDSIRCSKCNGLRVSSMVGLPSSSSTKSTGEVPSPRRPEDPNAHRERSGSVGGGQPGSRGIIRSAEDAGEMSPDPKRRRLTNAADSRGMAPIQVWAPERRHSAYPGHTPPSAGHDGHGRAYSHIGTPIPQQTGGPRHHHSSMPPPPRPPTNAAWSSPGYQFTGRPGTVDDSVRLPPLKTAITPSASPGQNLDSAFGYTPITAGLGISGGRDSPEKSAKEQIMSIPFTRKMAVVGKICPPLSRSGADGRGAIIAIEGSRSNIVAQVSQAVEKTLEVCQNAALKSWDNNSAIEGSATSPADTSKELEDLMPSIFEDILGWHRKSKQIISHVSNKRSASPSSNSGPSPAEADRSTKTGTPVALIKDGFNLTMSDKYACATSHSLKNYGPVDHWQWMATLWRGIVGPDLVVYVKACHEEDMEKLKTVEFQKQLGTMVVRVPKDKNLDEATERRLNFEIIEWITDVWPKGTSRN